MSFQSLCKVRPLSLWLATGLKKCALAALHLPRSRGTEHLYGWGYHLLVLQGKLQQPNFSIRRVVIEILNPYRQVC